jgi:anti-sigma factor RsiW
MNGHYAESMLQDYHDGVLSDAEQVALHAHLEECQTCAALDKRVMAFDRALRMVPLEQPGPAFTARVLARIDRRGPVEWLDRVLEPRMIAGTTFALFGAVGTMNAVLLSLPGDAHAGTGFMWGATLDGIARGIAAGPDALASWLRQFLPQVFSHGALQVSLAMVLLVPLFLCADRILARRRVPG